MDIKVFEEKGTALLISRAGETMELPILEFWEICRLGNRMDTRDEVYRYFEDLDLDTEYSGVTADEILQHPEWIEEIVGMVMDNRVQEESATQIHDAIAYFCEHRLDNKTKAELAMGRMDRWSGEVDVPFGFPGLERIDASSVANASLGLVKARLEDVPEFSDVVVERIGWYNSAQGAGLGVSFSFCTLADVDAVAERLQEVFEGLAFEACSEVQPAPLKDTIEAAKDSVSGGVQSVQIEDFGLG